jgi:uncharacterized membrane protein
MLECSGKSLIDEVHSYYTRINQDAQQAVNAFWAEFSAHYSELKALDNQAVAAGMKLRNNLTFVAPLLTASSSEATKNLDNYGGEYVGAGLGIGAVIGSFIIPVVGTVIGARIGALFGGMFSSSPDIEQIKNETWEKLSPGIDKAFDNIFDVIENDKEAYIQAIAQEIVKQIARSYVTYDGLVKKMIQQDEQEKKQLQKNVAVIQNELTEIENRKRSISESREKIKAD